ncbi:non-ribosomal peptide synthetase, partial [Chengkuizengella marina]
MKNIDEFTKNILLSSGQFDQELEYWLNQLSGELPISRFPMESISKVREYSKEILHFQLSEKVCNKIKHITKGSQLGMYTLLLSVYKLLLYKYTGSQDLIVATPIFGRRSSTDNYLNDVLLIRSQMKPTFTFKQWLNEVKKKVSDAAQNQNYVFSRITEKLGLEMNGDQSILQTMFVMNPLQNKHNIIQYQSDLIFEFDIQNDQIKLNVEFNNSLYHERMILQIANHLIHSLANVLNHPDQKISELDILLEEEKDKLLVDFNDTAVAYPKGKPIHKLFEEQVENIPNQIAVVFEEKRLTYKQLNEKSNQLARRLISKGIENESVVAIMAHRSIELIISVLAVWKAGAAYIPIDPEYPEERILYMLEDSQAELLIINRDLLDELPYSGETIDLDDKNTFIGNSSNIDSRITNSDHLAYIIYTSGTTGNPKGVMIEHSNYLNMVYAWKQMYDLDNIPIKLLQLASFSFDVFAGDLAKTLPHGGELVICPNEVKFDLQMLYQYIKKYEISMFESTPALIFPLLDYIYDQELFASHLKLIILGSDSSSISKYKELQLKFGSTIRIMNSYGVTEACIDASYYEGNKEETSWLGNLPIGRPIPNVNLYIVNLQNQLQPIGVAGELCIGGAGLARGYLNQPELTEEKFLKHPYILGERLYKTGDLAKWLPDGNIEFLGRMDYQVNIKGFRIELGEIESQLLKHPEIKEAVVTVKEDAIGDKTLCAYIVCDREFNTTELREYISQYLPEYMIPSFFLRLSKMPLTPNGKIDRKALPEPDESLISEAQYVAPRNEMESRFVSIWEEMLGKKGIGVQDNFFDLGGHSLKAVQMIWKLQKEMGISVTLKNIFIHQTIEKLVKEAEQFDKRKFISIPKIEENEVYTLSSSQKRLYVLHQIENASVSYNMPSILILKGEFNRVRFEGAIESLIRRHESLRTSFELVNGEPVQRIHKEINVECNEQHIEKHELDSFVSQFIQPFNLYQAPLFRVNLMYVDKQEHILFFDMHHIISDDISMNILIQDFAQLYEGKELPELRIQYKDFAKWQNGQSASTEMENQKQYWLDHFADDIPILELPTDYTRPVIQSFEGKTIEFHWDQTVVDKLNKLAKETNTTLYMILLAAYTTLLFKYTGQEDIIVGSPVAGRRHSDLEPIIGMFVNTVAMRNKPEAHKPLRTFLEEVKENTLKAIENESYPLEELIEKLDIQRDTSRNPLFSVMFNMLHMEKKELELKNLNFITYPMESKVSKFDLTLTVQEDSDKLFLSMEYCTKLFKKETIERMINHLGLLVEQMVELREVTLGELSVLSEEENHQLLLEFNDTKVLYPEDNTIHQLFVQQVEKTPDHIAVVFEDKQFTYHELNERANQLAWILKENGVSTERLVGIMVNRSLEMIISILAVLKAGGAYVPIDPTYPEERIHYMLDDSGTELLLMTEEYKDKVNFEGTILNLDDKALYAKDSSNPPCMTNTDHLAYVIYTSGSTGKPKGVCVEHQSLVNLSKWHKVEFQVTSADRSAKYASYAFDASVWELFPYLISGATVYIIPEEVRMNMMELKQYYQKHNITMTWLPPQMYEQLIELDPPDQLRVLFTGSDKVKSYKKNGYRVFNTYGPTESTVICTYYEMNEATKNISIGKPLANTQIYILDVLGQLQPVGVPGELCVAGAGLARGYLNQPELTKEKFVDNPFVPGERMYKTGDLARWLPDGNIEYLGRIDLQVKVRGYRIEPGEIEVRMLKLNSVKEVVVTVRKDENGHNYLCAYIVSDQELRVGYVREFLSKELPNYMIPSIFIQLEALPLTPNGKIDRKNLPAPEGNLNNGTVYAAPRNEKEKHMVSLWKEVLGVGKIGIHDNFFDLGGHSIKAMYLVAKLQQEIQVSIALKDIFAYPNIEQLVEHIEQLDENEFHSIAKVEQRDVYPASSPQKRLYVLQQLEGVNASYNMPLAMMLKGELNLVKFDEAIKKLIDRHESLRTSFELSEEEVVQRIQTKVDFEVFLQKAEKYEKIDKMISDFVQPFDLSSAPLFRMKLIQMDKEEHLFLLDMHHIISDGTSMNILVHDFVQFYEGKSLPELRIQYKDVAVWQHEQNSTEIMEQKKQYWLNQFADEIPVLDLPTDFVRPSMQSFEGHQINFRWNNDLTKKLKELAKETNTTLYMVLMAAYTFLLSKYSKQEDIIVGTPVAGRNHTDVEPIVGMFVNTLAIRNFPESNKTFHDFLLEVKENILQAIENESYPLEDLLENLNLQRDTSRNPLFSVLFNMLNVEQNEINLKDISLYPYSFENKVSNFDLTLNVVEQGGELLLSIEYCTKLFKIETIQRLILHLKYSVQQIINQPGIKLEDIELLSEDEKQQIITEFNNTTIDYPKEKTVIDLFEEQASSHSTDIAVIHGEAKITYEELNNKVNRLAKVLKNQGVKEETIVCLLLERSIEMVAMIMAIQKAGGAYLPIDRSNPKERIEYVLKDSHSDYLITDFEYMKEVDIQFSGMILDVTDLEELNEEKNNLSEVSPHHLAYIIYTSGSTGQPKGVMIEHKSLTNQVLALLEDYGYNKFKKHMLYSKAAFDVSVQHIFTALCSGAVLHLMTEEMDANYEMLYQYVHENEIDFIDMVPAQMEAIVNSLEQKTKNHRLVLGGEAFQSSLYKKIRKYVNAEEIFNMYGPTETTINALIYQCKEDESYPIIPIGKPIRNYQALILDEKKKILPIGVVGELYIGGDGLARGYLNNNQLTDEKFITHPFKEDEKIYRTGDLVRWLPDGNIEYVGRKDHQVKIRGHRIELGEIENQLLKHPEIFEALVTVNTDEIGDKTIYAYVVCRREFNIFELKEAALKSLPEYMIPTYFIQLDQMPLTSNGKIDRKALLELDGKQSRNTGTIAPRNENERHMVFFWKEVLGI